MVGVGAGAGAGGEGVGDVPEGGEGDVGSLLGAGPDGEGAEAGLEGDGVLDDEEDEGWGAGIGWAPPSCREDGRKLDEKLA